MWEKFAIDVFAAALLLGGWYWWFRRANHRRAVQILKWIEDAFSGHGSISGARWRGASHFHVDLRLCPSVFRRASVAVQLEPREMPLTWLLDRIRKGKETVTFEAELDHRPSHNLHIQKHYWSGRTRRKRPASLSGWHLESLTPMLISTKPNWQNDSSHMLEALADIYPHLRFPARSISPAGSTLCGDGPTGVAMSRSPRGGNV